jgi:hypothetical protein
LRDAEDRVRERPRKMCLFAKGIDMSELKLRPPKRHPPPTSNSVGARHAVPLRLNGV